MYIFDPDTRLRDGIHLIVWRPFSTLSMIEIFLLKQIRDDGIGSPTEM